MLEFSYRPQVFYGFYRGEGKSDGTLIEWQRNIDVLVAISSPLILVEKSVVKLLTFESSNPGEIWKITSMRNETKSISVRVTQFLVDSIFYKWTFIKSEFLCIWSAWRKHIICLSRNKLFQHAGILYRSWLTFTVCLLLSQQTPLDR